MADGIVVPQTPPLSRIANVELMHVGTWPISTGVFTFTTEDLYQAVAALGCPAIRRPILKLGHVDPRFDGEPAVGYIDNLGVADNGYSLVGDYAGMPGWLGDIAASAYPDRSIEGQYDFVCQMGHTHPFVLTAVALLGVAAPGIGSLESLQDIAHLYGVDLSVGIAGAQASRVLAAAAARNAPKATPGTASTVHFSITAPPKGAAMPNLAPRTVAATVTSDDVSRAFYSSSYGQDWAKWIQEIQLDPLQIIYCDDATGETFRIPVTVDASKDAIEGVTFGAPVKVVLRFDDATVAAAAGAPEPIRFASRDESRPGQRPAATEPPAEPAEGTTPNTTPEDIVADAPSTLREGLLSRLGVTDADADESILLAALDEALTERATPPTPPATPAVPVLPEGVTVIDTAALQELQVAAAAGQEARRQQLTEDRDTTVRAAVRDGRIPVAREAHWKTSWDKDPEGAKAALASLAPGLVPVQAQGQGGSEPTSDEDAVFASLFGQEAKV